MYPVAPRLWICFIRNNEGGVMVNWVLLAANSDLDMDTVSNVPEFEAPYLLLPCNLFIDALG
ncbi:hypothetical protein SERLA73DRAFT_179076 [Serpula lacrymans var. lacrymans S7.3]|uniref:Uncharacterized protein n=2 Tax=Serpula lacrymans var. lacrymans TaxID=341189 RepID=F8PTP2_SERL3|nr:uncharacterized protein SERLADRAFT_464027 [Serpula lacrymans var. lacrymans S7.9]EGO01037.1 hypothetical protein SERLA73DRAFT_179076 [Serpula lacrymans var. lacrymans S7.3]EGO26702.1 hypothetical protein SERLADRAFT_464027 [Serpula lacrymans var. lacrymans S7.9]